MSRRTFLVSTLASILVLASMGIVYQQAAASDDVTAEQLVAEALHRGLYGLQSDRDRLLAEAVSVDPHYPPARWHQGNSYRAAQPAGSQ